MHPGSVHFGPLHIPILGVFAAIGVVAALMLSQRTARSIGLYPGEVWNAGKMAVVAAFVISRLLLIVFNWRSFLTYPLVVLAFPSLTSLGVAVTGLFLLAYLRWRRMPLLPFLDAMASCAALLWSFVSAGRLADGTRDGMPTRSVWSDRTVITAIYPVEAYTLASAALICLLLLWAGKVHGRAGTTAAIGLGLAGLAAFFIDFFRLPSDLLVNGLLDPAQVVAMVMILSGGVLYLRARLRMQTAADQAETENEEHDAV